MEKLFEKLDAYQFFNNALPGAVFVWACKIFFNIAIPSDGLIETIALYYMAGLVIGRISSLIVEPFLRTVKFLTHVEYKDFIQAEKNDQKVRTISDINNCYRSLFTCILVLPLAKGWEYLVHMVPWVEENGKWIILVLLVILFGASYRKQSKYVCDRVNVVNSSSKKEDS